MANGTTQELTRENSYVEITQDNVTLASEVRHRGNKFAATLLPNEGIFNLIRDGLVPGAVLREGQLAVEGQIVPDITLGYDGNGNPITVPGDRRAEYANDLPTHRDGLVQTYGAPTVRDEAAAKRLGMEPVAGLADLERKLAALDAQVKNNSLGQDESLRANVADTNAYKGALSDTVQQVQTANATVDLQVQQNAQRAQELRQAPYDQGTVPPQSPGTAESAGEGGAPVSDQVRQQASAAVQAPPPAPTQEQNAPTLPRSSDPNMGGGPHAKGARKAGEGGEK